MGHHHGDHEPHRGTDQQHQPERRPGNRQSAQEHQQNTPKHGTQDQTRQGHSGNLRRPGRSPGRFGGGRLNRNGGRLLVSKQGGNVAPRSPLFHALGPHQRILAQLSRTDQLRQLAQGDRTQLLIAGGVIPELFRGGRFLGLHGRRGFFFLHQHCPRLLLHLGDEQFRKFGGPVPVYAINGNFVVSGQSPPPHQGLSAGQVERTFHFAPHPEVVSLLRGMTHRGTKQARERELPG